MCGFAGFIGFENNYELAIKANKTQYHRGPDNQQIWIDAYISLAFQRLSIIDLSEKANQPFVKYNLVILFNGEIYNYMELKQELLNRFHIQFISNSDTEVLLELFYHYGTHCLDKLLGMFSFAIYNMESHELLLVRDHFGIKPLFYTSFNGKFAFASELKTLTTLPGINKDINYKSLAGCLNYLWIPGNESMFKNCFKLPPAYYMQVNCSLETKKVCYWNIDNSRVSTLSEKEIAGQLSSLISESVSRHLVADVPVSSFLSGGLDSSLISVLAQKEKENLSTYTITTEQKDKKIEGMPDDEKYADFLAQKYHFNAQKIAIHPEIMDQLPAMVRTLDEPIGDPAAINTFLMCQSARKQGVKVILSGMGADEIFFGYRRQKSMLLAQKYRMLPSFIRSMISKTTKDLPVSYHDKGLKLFRWGKRFLNYADMPLSEGNFRSLSYYNLPELADLLKSEHTEEVDELYENYLAIFNDKFSNDAINRICYTDMIGFMNGLNLTYTDRSSMAASVEVRVPFIDKKVIEFAMQIPGKYKYCHGESKYILKKAAEPYLPKEIIYRPKAAFGAPLRSWISNELRPMVDDLLSESSVKKRGLLNYIIVNKLISDDRKGYFDNAYQIYQLLTLELWFREFVD